MNDIDTEFRQKVFDYLQQHLSVRVSLAEIVHFGGECCWTQVSTKVFLTNPITGEPELISSHET